MPTVTEPSESRCIVQSRVELRAAGEGSASPGTLVGYGAVFGSRSRDLGGWFEVIDPGAFGAPGEGGALDVAQHVRIIARTNHDSNLLLGTTDAGTLRLYLDDAGLRYEVDLPATSYARDLAVLADRGDIRFSSFAFRPLPGGTVWREDTDDALVAHRTAVRLVDVAPVADPAYWDTTSGLRALDLDAIRASLHKTPAPPGDREKAARDRAAAIRKTIGRGL